MSIVAILLIGVISLGQDFQMAKKAYEEEDYERAIEGFRKLASESKDALFYLGLSYYKTQRWIDAGITFSRFCERFPDDDRLEEAFSKGIESYLYCNKTDNAFKLFKQFSYIPLAPELGYRLGKALEDNQEYKKAYRVYSELESEDAGLWSVEVLLKTKRIEKAKRLLFSLISKNSALSDRVYFKIFSLYLNKGDTLSAIESLLNIKDIKKLKPTEALFLADFLIWEKDFKKAERCLNIAKNDSLCREKALKELTFVYRNLRDYEREEEVLQTLEPSGWVRRELSWVRCMLNKEFDRSFVPEWNFLDPSEFKQTVERLYQRGDYKEALELLLSSPFSLPWVYLMEGKIYEKYGDYSTAIKAYEEFIKAKVMGERIREAEKRIEYIRNYELADYEKATEELLRCQTLEEKGKVLFKFTKDYEKAISYLKNAETEEGLYYLGLSYEFLYRKTKDPKFLNESKKVYKDIIIRFPGSWTAEAASFRRASLIDDISEYEKFIAFYPKGKFSDTALFKLGMKYLVLGDTLEAKEKLERIEKEFPRSPLYPTAVFTITRLDTVKRMKRLSSLVSLSLKDSISYLSLRDLYKLAVSREAYGRAIRFLEEMFRNFSHPQFRDVRAYVHLLIETGNFRRALRFLKEQPKSGEYQLLKAEVLAALRKDREAMLLLCSFYPETYESEYLYLKAEIAKRLKRLRLTQECLEKLMRLPYRDEYFFKGEELLAELYFDNRDFNRAIPLYKDLLNRSGLAKYLPPLIISLYRTQRLSEGDSLLEIYGEAKTPLRLSRLKCLLDNYRLQESRQEISQIVAMEPSVRNNPEFIYYEGLLELKSENFDKAIEKFSQLRRFKDSRFSSLANFKIATCYYRKGYWERAIDFYKKVLKDTSLRKDALFNIAIIYKDKKRWDEAISLYRKLLKETKDPKFERDIKFRIGYTYFQKRDFVKALSILRDLRGEVRNRDERCEIIYWIGESYFSLGLFVPALFEFMKIYRFYPEKELWKITSELRMGMCYEMLDKKEKAKEVYIGIVERRGREDGWAKEALERLKALE